MTESIDEMEERVAFHLKVAGITEWESRVRALEEQGLTRSDAQAVVDAEDAKNV